MASKYTSEYRNEIFTDVYSGKLPDRVPEKIGITVPQCLSGQDTICARHSTVTQRT